MIRLKQSWELVDFPVSTETLRDLVLADEDIELRFTPEWDEDGLTTAQKLTASCDRTVPADVELTLLDWFAGRSWAFDHLRPEIRGEYPRAELVH